MATVAQTLSPPDLYEKDLYLWLEQQAKALAARDTAALDWDNLAEEIDSLGRSEKRELRNRLLELYHHLLKWQYQPERRSHSWQTSIGEQRSHIVAVLEDSPSLRRFLPQCQTWSYEHACRRTEDVTGIAGSTFPKEVPWSLADVLSSKFMPGLPWKPEDLIRD